MKFFNATNMFIKKKLKSQKGAWQDIMWIAIGIIVVGVVFKPWIDTFARGVTTAFDTWWTTMKSIIFTTS